MKHKGNRPVNRARPGRDARREKALNFFCGAAGILTFLALWQLGATYSRFGRFIPGPIEVIPKFFLSFTQPIGMSASFDRELIRECGRCVGEEARAL